jgi:hypothetical protein
MDLTRGPAIAIVWTGQDRYWHLACSVSEDGVLRGFSRRSCGIEFSETPGLTNVGDRLGGLMAARPNMKVTLCGAFLLFAANVAAQPQRSSEETTRLQGGLGFLAAAAIGDFGTDVGGATGVLVQFDVGLGKSLFSIGGEFAAMS